VNFARGLQDMPPNELHPKEFAEMVKKQFTFSYYKELFSKVGFEDPKLKRTSQETLKSLSESLEQIKIEILDKKQIEKNKMGLLLAVNAGSHHEPRVIVIRYMGNPKSKEILGLVGKGITFDSGGYNLKSSTALETMKFDMSGAAVVCASLLTLIHRKPKINVVVVACLTENVIGGHATLTESVVTSMSGKTVEINNTDAEGRLVLADGITYAIEKEKVTKIITVATLTGAVISALGENLTGVMTNNRKFYREFRQALAKSHERY
jgi:leucyl aminopeptidase